MVLKNVLLNRIALLIAFLSIAGWVRADLSEKEERRLPPPILTAKPLETTPKDDEQQKLLKALYNERQAITATYYKDYRQGRRENADPILDCARRLLRTGMELYQSREDQLKLLKEMAELADRVELNAIHFEEQYGATQSNGLARFDSRKAREFKLEIELETLKLKKAAGKK
jgi:hypothetical protein